MKAAAVAGRIVLALLGLALAWAHWPGDRLPMDATADRVLVRKSARELVLMRGGAPIKRYRIALGRNPEGAKLREGDGRTPEGCYLLDRRNSRSAFHLALHVSYPNASDSARAAARAVDPGGLIMVHGLRNGLGFLGRWHALVDWTEGCIAVTDPEIEEIWRTVPDGTPIEIVP